MLRPAFGSYAARLCGASSGRAIFGFNRRYAGLAAGEFRAPAAEEP